MLNLTLPLAAEELVPHRLPMRLVDRVLVIDGQNGTVEALIRADCPLVNDAGRLEPVALIELLAQGYAALKGYLDRRDGKAVRQGFLVGVKKMSAHHPIQAGELLRIDIRTLAELDDFAVAAGEVHCGDLLVAEAELKVWIHK